MSLERACVCGRAYLATSPYDYSCPDCWRAECIANVRVIEWVGGRCPLGAVAIEHTPLTPCWESARDFLVEHGPGLFYTAPRGDGSSPMFLPCMIQPYRQRWTLRIHESLLVDEDAWHATHERERIGDAPEGWYWFDTELAWVADPTEIDCTETECCLAQR